MHEWPLYQGLLQIRMPVPEPEFNKEISGDMAAGIEPDTCFYIQNHLPQATTIQDFRLGW